MYAGPGAERPLRYVGLLRLQGPANGTMSVLVWLPEVLRKIGGHFWNQRDETNTTVLFSLKSGHNCGSWVAPQRAHGDAASGSTRQGQGKTEKGEGEEPATEVESGCLAVSGKKIAVPKPVEMCVLQPQKFRYWP